MRDDISVLERLINSESNIIIGKEECSYCDKAVALLKKENIEFIYLDYLDCNEFILALKKSLGKVTYPQIFLNGKRIGGFTDLEKMVNDSKLVLEKSFLSN